LADSSCAFDTVSHYGDAEDLAEKFLEKDGRGAFLQANSWFDGATTCPGHEPGPDAFVVVQDHHLAFDTLPGDTVRASVTYHTLGTLAGGRHFDVDTGEHVRILRVVHTPFGWRILSPALDQHVEVNKLFLLTWLPDSLRRRVLALSSHRGA